MLIKPFGFLGSQGGGASGYGNPPWNSNVLFYYNFGEETSWGSGSGATATIIDVEGNTNADLIGPGWAYDDGSGTNMGVGSASQLVKGSPSGRGIIPDNTIGGPYNGFAGEYLFKTPSVDWSGDNIFARITKGSFTDSLLESNIQQYGGSPVPDRIYYEGSSEDGRGGAIFYALNFEPETWYHVVFSMEQGEYTKLYINGSHVATGGTQFGVSDTWEWTINTVNDRYILGSNGDVNWTGYIAAIRWYSENATDSNVLSNYNHFADYVTF